MATDTALPLHSSPATACWDPEQDQDLVCIDVRSETHDVKTFTFRARAPRLFDMRPGQYFSFEVEIGGEAHSRCYSISSSTLVPSCFSITVKRVVGGAVSKHLHDTLRVGDTVRAHGPGGTFVLPEEAPGPYLFVSGGSGITPVMAMTRTLADAHRHPDIVFLHAARSPADLVFGEELLHRARVTPHFRLILLPEHPGTGSGYSGVTGRVSEALLAHAVPDLAQRTVMCCGPAPFMAAVKALSLSLGVPASRYVEESFTAAEVAGIETAAPAAPAARATPGCQVSFAKQARTLTVAPGQTVLAAARQAGVSLPSSCANGVCGTCKSKLISGTVDMRHHGGIRQREIDAGLFLPCCSTPTSDLVVDR